MPKGILLALGTLIVTAFLIAVINPAINGVGAHRLAQSGEPVLEGFRAMFGGAGADILGLIALSGLVASFHAILFAQGRQIFALSRSGYLPPFLSLAHNARKTPFVAMIFGCGIGLAFMVGLTMFSGSKGVTDARIGGLLLNMAVFAAMLSYLSRAAAFLVLRRDHADLPRPFVSPFGRAGGLITIVMCMVTLAYQVRDAAFLDGVVWVVVWMGLGICYFMVFARHRLVLSPDEAAALARR